MEAQEKKGSVRLWISKPPGMTYSYARQVSERSLGGNFLGDVVHDPSKVCLSAKSSSEKEIFRTNRPERWTSIVYACRPPLAGGLTWHPTVAYLFGLKCHYDASNSGILKSYFTGSSAQQLSLLAHVSLLLTLVAN